MKQSAAFCEELYNLAKTRNGENIKIELNGVSVLVIQRYEDADYILRTHAKNYRKNMGWFRQVMGYSRFSEEGDAWRIRRDLSQAYFSKFDRENSFQLSAQYAENAMSSLITASCNGSLTLDETVLREMTAGVLVHNFFDVPIAELNIDLSALTELMEYGSEYSFVPEGRTNDMYRKRLATLPEIRRRVLDSLKVFRSEQMPASPLLNSLLEADKNLGVILEHELIGFLAAGTEASAATVSWMCHLLATHPDKQTSLRKDAMAFWLGNDHSWKALSTVKSLAYFVSEALRLYPTTPIIARLAENSDKIGNFDIDKDQNILISFIGIQHDQRFRNDPWKIQEEEADILAIGSGINTAFSIGTRVCGGKHFALLELITFLSVFLREGSLEMTSDEEPNFYWKTQLLRDGGQRVRVRHE